MPRPGSGGEHARVGAACLDPPLVVGVAQAGRPRRPAALPDAAGRAAEYRIGGIEHQDAGPELGPDFRHQAGQQPGALVPAALPGRDHQDTSFPVSQPAFSSAARASCAVRCPYTADVVVTDE